MLLALLQLYVLPPSAIPLQPDLLSQLKRIDDPFRIPMTEGLFQCFRIIIQLYTVTPYQILRCLHRIRLIIQQDIPAVFLEKDIYNPLDDHRLLFREVTS